MKFINFISPKWLKKLDLNLLIKHPIIWECRLHYFLYFGSILSALLLFLAWMFPFDLSNLPSPRFFLFVGLILQFISFAILLFYIQDQNRRKKKVFSIKEAYGLSSLYLVNNLFLFLPPLLLFNVLLGNAQSNINWEEIDYFEKAIELYDFRINDAQVKTYALLTEKNEYDLVWGRNQSEKIDYQKFNRIEFKEEAKNKLLRWNKGNSEYVSKKLNKTIDAINFSVPVFSQVNYKQALENEIIHQSVLDVVPNNFLKQGRVNIEQNIPELAVGYINNLFKKIEQEYNRTGTNQDQIFLSLLSIFLIFMGTSWCLLSRGYTYTGTNFITLIFLVFSGCFILCFSEYAYHSIIKDLDYFNAKFIAPFWGFLIVFLLTVFRRQNTNNQYLLTLSCLMLMLLAPIYYYNSISSEFDLVLMNFADWDSIINPFSVLMLLVFTLLIIIHSLLIFSQFNINPKR